MEQETQIKQRVIDEIGKAVIGKEEVIIKAFATILAGGHILFEDIPGVGKTTMAMAISKVLSLQYNRLQFTTDVMPSDVLGYSLYNKEAGVMQYKKGVIMCNLFLADEINRTSSKTQAALLEAMEEKKVTVVEYAGDRIMRGFNGLTNGPVEQEEVKEAAIRRAIEKGFI